MTSAQDIQQIANELRADSLEMVALSGAGHIAGPLSSADFVAMLYFGGFLRYDPYDPDWDERDRFVLSCGHYCPILYAALARAGYFPTENLAQFGQMGSEVALHPEKRVGDHSLPGVESSSGPLGQGVSVAVGMALALKLRYGARPQAKTPRVYCLLSDGELQEGQVWEAFTFAVRRQLDNLIFVVDCNRVQIENYVSQLATYGSVAGRMESFGLVTLEVNGHDMDALRRILTRAHEMQGGPVMIVLHTTAGKGVRFMENTPEWHDRVPTDIELQKAFVELGVET